jgi:hypothetical protein
MCRKDNGNNSTPSHLTSAQVARLRPTVAGMVLSVAQVRRLVEAFAVSEGSEAGELPSYLQLHRTASHPPACPPSARPAQLRSCTCP